MLIDRKNLIELYQLIQQKSNCYFSIDTSYKLLKIKNKLKEEINIYNTQLNFFIDFIEKDEKGNLIKNENGFKIKEKSIDECQKKINELNEYKIQLPDIYFSLDELEQLKLSLYEVELLQPFIKN